jgi:hypothetical protein
MRPRKLATATLFTGFAVTLAACGAGSSSHVVARLTPTTAVASTSTTAVTVPGTGTSSTPGSVPVNGTPTTAPSESLNPQTLDQVAADLGDLDNSLNTANSDLNNPQGDS